MSDELKEEGLALFRRGMHDEALAKFEAAASAYAESGDEAARGEMLNNIGVVQRVRQNWEAAEDAFCDAIDLFEKSGDDHRRAQSLGNLGDLYAFQGQPETAAHYYSEAVELMAASGDREKQAQLLRALSLLRLRQRRFVEAMGLMEQSLQTRPRLNIFQRFFLFLIGIVHRLLGGP
ncbi:MAG: tetratricopeptide repeat protein [bacterium]